MGIRNKIKNIFNLLWNKKEEKTSFFTKENFNNPKFSIGDYTYGNPKILFSDSGAYLSIGKFCSIANGVVIFLGGEHRTEWISTYPFNVIFSHNEFANKVKGHPKTKGDVIIGNDVWIGNSATILSGVKVSNGAVIAANSVVTKDVGPYEIWGGNPARFIKKRFSNQKIEQLLEQEWWNWGIDKILTNVDYLCSVPK